MAKKKYERRITPTEAFVPAGMEIRDEVIAEVPAGIDLGEATVTEEDPGSALPMRGKGPVPDRSLADRLRERAERAG